MKGNAVLGDSPSEPVAPGPEPVSTAPVAPAGLSHGGHGTPDSQTAKPTAMAFEMGHGGQDMAAIGAERDLDAHGFGRSTKLRRLIGHCPRQQQDAILCHGLI